MFVVRSQIFMCKVLLRLKNSECVNFMRYCCYHSRSTVGKSTLITKTWNKFLQTSVNNSQDNMSLPQKEFRLSDYDCIGFDLDFTISMYNIVNMIKMEYGILASYLVREKGYDGKYLMQPVDDSMSFFMKGLMLDFDRGNILKISGDGYVLKCCHGTSLMTRQEIKETYGVDCKWDIAIEFCKDVLAAWNGPLSLKTRTLLDYFDVPVSLIFARLVDTLDESNGKKLDLYNIWPDILEGLYYMYRRENFETGTDNFFSILKSKPDNYVMKCDDKIISWLKMVKENKKVFLITGSNIDYASVIAKNTLGEGWQDLFDIVVCYARKPGFFVSSRPFLGLNGFVETDPIVPEDLKPGNVYSQGNWKDLYKFLSKISCKSEPKCVYIGDNLIQDIFIPHKYVNCDTVAVVNEMGLEQQSGEDEGIGLGYNIYWGSYFKEDKLCENSSTIWSEIIMNHSKLCLPSFSSLTENPLDYNYPTFSNESGTYCIKGFYPHLKILSD